MAYISRTNGDIEQIPSSQKIDMEFANSVIPKGYVERVFPKRTPDVVFLCHEEGHIRQLPWNKEGWRLYGSPIAGDIIVMSRLEAKRNGWT